MHFKTDFRNYETLINHFPCEKNGFPKYIDNAYNLTESLMRSYEVDIGQTWNEWNILQITLLLKIKRTTVRE